MTKKIVDTDKLKVKIQAKVDPSLMELLELMLPKANLTLDDVVDASARNWIVQNTDLLTKADRDRFKQYL